MAYTLIGYLVQKFSGVPYKQYIQEHIFTPLEMTSTAFEPRPDMDERLSIPYTVEEKTGSQVAAVRLRASVWPAGIVYGTVLNQANWLIANLNGGAFKEKRIISEQTLEQMFTRQYDQFKGGIEGIWGNETAGFGLTWWTQVRDGDRYIAHSGSVPGYTAFLLGNRDRKLGFLHERSLHRAGQSCAADTLHRREAYGGILYRQNVLGALEAIEQRTVEMECYGRHRLPAENPVQKRHIELLEHYCGLGS